MNALRASEEVLLVPRERIGDSLIALVVAHNLARAGHTVSVWNESLAALADWFPELRWLDRAPTSVPVVIHQNQGTLRAKGVEGARATHFLSGHELFRAKRARVDIYVDACRELFGLTDVERTNGLVPMAAERNPQRVVVHPAAREPKKAWPRTKFARLCTRLRQREFDVAVLLAPGADPGPLSAFPCHSFERLDDVARFLQTAAAFVGNDSGIGHLASNLGLPTTTLFVREAIARRWRPAWAPGVVVLPSVQLPTTFLKYRTWKSLTSVDAVERAFDSLHVRC